LRSETACSADGVGLLELRGGGNGDGRAEEGSVVVEVVVDEVLCTEAALEKGKRENEEREEEYESAD
jgi:hypothetical protein